MRVAGSLLFIVGIVAALISAAKLPALGTTWSDILPVYGGAVLLAVIGLLLLRWSKMRPGNSLKMSYHPTCLNVMDLLQQLLAEMQILGSQINDLDEAGIAKRVNSLHESYVLPFAAAAPVIGSQSQSVELVVAFSQGECLLNRMWSAASDGNKTEAIATYPKALAAFEQAFRWCD